MNAKRVRGEELVPRGSAVRRLLATRAGGECRDLQHGGLAYNELMTIWIRRCEGFEEEAAADRDFWAALAPDDRVAVVEQMRREWWISNGRRDEGLRRFVRVLREAGR